MKTEKKETPITLSGFTFVKNALKYDYPVVESILSILPFVDEMIVNVGTSEDETEKLIESIPDPKKKIRIIKNTWPLRFVEKSRVLAMQTNLALYECQHDWCFYIQADEVFKPDDMSIIKKKLQQAHKNPEIEALLFDYVHFFGNYDWCANSYQWYRKEIRLIRNHIGITSYKDAQGFRLDCKKLKALDTGAKMHHYGWVRLPEKMQKKKEYHDSLYHRGDKLEKENANFQYENFIDPKMLKKFTGTHPPMMKERIQKYNNEFDPYRFPFKPTLKQWRYRVLNSIGKVTGFYLGEYRNYKIVKYKPSAKPF